ncbi:FYVE, RhoGEF and PH domain-containing protein 6 [Eurytemora carolleeae]|uniref:FYVE, RhoGEF and PH domain-containing protein 6 n=1 Tax=Eurytemora carolleeae TaxID=1294199 RepID=UPI000C76637F|nr:FYVE, RhoGEF and PH domain-containing protein 6 [Eurytemora carolleeae]|eukprot:XP_023327012.1 FYVE, RhoGEF and PH domain-containing protein 6-like [Eurytemora affinis]
MSGHLRRRLKNNKWKRSWFVLKERVLYIYRASEDTIAAETLPVLGWTLQPLAEKNFELYEGLNPGLVFQLSHSGQESMVFSAENDNFAEKWMTALREATIFE